MLLLYTHTITHRLQYVVDFIGKELFDEAIHITTDEAYFRASEQPRLNYSPQELSDAEFFLRNTSLLFETGQVDAAFNAHWIVWAALIFGGLISSIVANAFLFQLVQKYEVSRTTPYLLMTPVISFTLQLPAHELKSP